MFSQFDLVEELASIAKAHNFIHTEDVGHFKGKVLCLSGGFFMNKMVELSQSGDLLTGFSLKAIKNQIDIFLKKAAAIGFNFKLVFNGSDLYVDKAHFNRHCQIKKRFYHLLWKLEIMKCLGHSHNEGSLEGKALASRIDAIKSIVYKSGLYRDFVERDVTEFVLNYLFEAKVEFIVAPGKAVTQMVWLYSYDYCEAVVGDLSLLPFAETLPQAILDIDFDKGTFSYINLKEFSESLKLVKGKEKRQAELWAFTVPSEQLTEGDFTIVLALEEKIKDMEDKLVTLRKERNEKVMTCLAKISSVLSRIDTTSINNDKAFADQIAKLTDNKCPKREQIIYGIDNGQIINSTCEFLLFPNTRTFTMPVQDEQKLRASTLVEFQINKRLNAFYSFDVFNPQMLLLTTKVTRHHIYFGPPVSDSKEYRSIVEEVLPSALGTAFSFFLSVFGKLSIIIDYTVASYCVNNFPFLAVKDFVVGLESGDKVLYYFKEAAFKKFEKDNPAKGAALSKISFKNTTSMIFQCFSAAAESSDLIMTQLSLKKSPGVPELNMSTKEIMSFIIVNLLDDLEYVNIKQKKFMILGAGLMRKVSDVLEEKLVLLLELTKLGLMNGDFMNPPDINLTRHKKKHDNYLVTSLRKTSEELRNKKRSPRPSKEEDNDNLSRERRKESEFLLNFDEEFNRDPTIYDYEKIVNVISLTVQKCKQRYEHHAATSKQLSEESIDLFAQGLHEKNIPKIVMISRVFCLIDAEAKLAKNSTFDFLQDFDTSQFLSVLSLTQKMLRLKVEGLCSIAINHGNKSLSLKDIEEIKTMLPFRGYFNGQLSNIVKILLTQYCLIQQLSRANKPQLTKEVEAEFSLEAVLARYPNFTNLKETLQAGYHLFMNLMKILEYGQEKGIDKQSSPVVELWVEARDMLKDCFKKLGLTD